MKSKNSGSRTTTLKSTTKSASKGSQTKVVKSKSVQSKVDASKLSRIKTVVGSKAAKSPKEAAPQREVESPKLRTVKVTKAPQMSVAERLSSAARAVKAREVVAVKPQSLKLKLVAKAPSKIPVSKITRSEPSSYSNKVVTGHFGGESSAPARPVLAIRSAVIESTEESSTGGVELVIFKAGDKIVYPGHGVGEIESVKTTVLGGEEHHLYNIKILETGMKVMVPLKQASAVGIRRIIDKKAIDRVYDILRDRDFKIDTQTWNRRFREYSQKIKTGSVYEIAIVLRDLSVLSADKELSFGEKKMLDMAESLLVSEIAIAKARPQDKIVGELRALFA